MRHFVSPEIAEFDCEVEDCPNHANHAVLVLVQKSMLENGWAHMFMCHDHVDWERDSIIASDRKLKR